MQKKPYQLIAIEGIDGSGKTLQMELLKTNLEKTGASVGILSFPQYDSFFGKQIGDLLRGDVLRADHVDSKSMCLWYALDRWQAFQKTELATCNFWIINRYTLSNAVYQAIRLIDSDLSDDNWLWVKELEHGQLGLPEPDLYMLLDIEPVQAQSNVDQKGPRTYIDGRDVYEQQEGLLLRAKKRYLDIAQREKNIAVISCMQDAQSQYSPEHIAGKIFETLQHKGII